MFDWIGDGDVIGPNSPTYDASTLKDIERFDEEDHRLGDICKDENHVEWKILLEDRKRLLLKIKTIEPQERYTYTLCLGYAVYFRTFTNISLIQRKKMELWKTLKS